MKQGGGVFGFVKFLFCAVDLEIDNGKYETTSRGTNQHYQSEKSTGSSTECDIAFILGNTTA